MGVPYLKALLFSHPIILRNSLLLLVFCVLLSIRFYILHLCPYPYSHEDCVCVHVFACAHVCLHVC